MGHHDSTFNVTKAGVAAVALAAVLVASACRPSPDEEPELEAIDVEPSLQIDIENDQEEVRRPPELTGILPEDFPKDIPLYLPASLVEIGNADGGWYFVELLSPHALAPVESGLSARLKKSGWTAGGGREYRKGDRRVRLSIEDAKPGTRYRFEYPP